jgi:hypothetical protein
MFSKEDYESKLKEISKLAVSVVLDKDPIVVGLSSFNEKLAVLQASRERLTALLTEALWNKTEAQNNLDAKDFNYTSKFNALLTTDPDVQKLKSKEQRESHINVVLLPELTALQNEKKIYLYAETYTKNVYAVEKSLEVKNDNLIQQINTVRMMKNIDPSIGR